MTTARTAEQERITTLEATLTEVLRSFWQHGHPGTPSVRTGWVNVTTVDRWRDVLLEKRTPGPDIAVARDVAGWCETCEARVTRGQAYLVMPGTGGLVQHVHCPDGAR